MDYNYESLGPERFQEFCQSLLLNEFKNFQVFPVGQPDGGRDALGLRVKKDIRNNKKRDEFVVFQIKYHRNPFKIEKPHKWLVDIIEGEASKIEKLITKGAKEYYLITNVKGTGHLDVGSIDKVSKVLKDRISIPTACWWRDDLSKRLDNLWDLKWIYPELLSGLDMLRHIIESRLSEEKEKRSNAVRAYLRDQYELDSLVKFKQIELQNKLLELFIDVPIQKRSLGGNPYMRRSSFIFYQIYEEHLDGPKEDVARRFHSVAHQILRGDKYLGTSTMLLHPNVQKYIPKIVIEGGPGQGKSTIVQYVCQVHRMRILKVEDDLRIIPKHHKETPLKLPIKIDIRDLASWITGNNPFPEQGDELFKSKWKKSLEAFLAAHISSHSGGIEFEVNDLHEVVKLSSILIVLDGFDEVADIEIRQEIVTVIDKGINRLKENALSLQVIITSRPAAFTNSPGFPEDQYPYFELDSINRYLIDAYADKWRKAKNLDTSEYTEIKRVLNEKLEQAHIRELAKNPMQLAILISLIYKRGESLPDKRTALYDSYIDLFLDRESGKDKTIRDYRDLIVDIHRYLAWELHSDAEKGSNGRIEREKLIDLLKDYLQSEGRNANLAELLFAKMVERVVAIVSRTQDIYEFEVQPLREYFCAKHLYVTAPYSPPGKELKGTKPDRFDAIASNFYWLNVVRFYAGCFDKGELPALIDRLEELVNKNGFRYISHPRILASMLLSDWVFTQYPRLMKEVVSILFKGKDLRVVLGSEFPFRQKDSLSIPESCGRAELVEKCFELLKTFPKIDLAIALISLISNNYIEDIENIWQKEIENFEGSTLTDWLNYGYHLNILRKLSIEQLDYFFKDNFDTIKRIGILINAKLVYYIESNTKILEKALNAMLDGNLITFEFSYEIRNEIYLFAQCLSTPLYSRELSFGIDSSETFHTLFRSRDYSEIFENLKFESKSDFFICNSFGIKCKNFIKIAKEEQKKPIKHWKTKLIPWDNIIEKGRKDFGDRWIFVQLANVAASIKSKKIKCNGYSDLFDDKKSLCKRVRYARLRAGSYLWWKNQFNNTSTSDQILLALLVCLTWAGPATILKLLETIDGFLKNLKDDEYSLLFNALERANKGISPKSNYKYSSFKHIIREKGISIRLILLISLKLNDRGRQSLYNDNFSEYQGRDNYILEFCMENAIKELNELKNIDKNLALIKHCYKENLNPEFKEVPYLFGIFRSNKTIPLKYAIKIMKDSVNYPLSLLEIAESVCRNDVARNAIPVREIANKERWFEQV